jgi:CubicO group peptidase (beta-lactamase class C family)
MTGALSSVSSWPGRSSAGWTVAGPGAQSATLGPSDDRFEWASVTKVLTALAVWVAVEEGTVSLDDPVGPAGSTLAHLLAHASGLAPDDETVLAAPGRRRIYSNRGFEVAAEHLSEQAGMPFGDYLLSGVIEPLGMGSTTLEGSAASGARGSLSDLLALGRELLAPRLVDPRTVDLATAVAFPGLSGVLPGFGPQSPNDWGLGVELRDSKQPHWTGTLNSPRTFGHFGRSGSFLWVDPSAGLAAAAVSERPFGPWAKAAWPRLSDAIIAERSSVRFPPRQPSP